MKTKMLPPFGIAVCSLLLSLAICGAQTTPGAASHRSAAATSSGSSITPFATETGKVSMSLDAVGTNATEGPTPTLRVQKPAGGTVRKAYLMSATTPYGTTISDGDITLNGSPVTFTTEVDSTVSGLGTFHNYRADVTSLVKPTVDAAPPGIVTILVTENSAKTTGIDGEILAVIFDDPTQVANNTVVFLFGAQNPNGDSFTLNLTNPIDKTAAGFALDFSLGISFSYQFSGSQQFSTVDVNGHRLTSAAGGEDDGASTDGALITVGGIGDSNANPVDPNAPPTNPRSDDELYTLAPFVSNGDHTIQVNTANPSNDDNIFFAAFFVGANNASVGPTPTPTPTPGAGPLNPYYLTAGEQHKNWVVQVTSLVSSWAQQHVKSVGESALSVTDFVRNLGTFYTNITTLGSRYTLPGSYTGQDYAYPVAGAAFWDGASDGTSNYSVDFAHGGVYKFDSNWTSPVKLFSTSSDYLGITFDTWDQTFWISKFHTGLVEHRSMEGTLLSSFTTPFTGISSLAIDRDLTLWMGSQNTKGTFYQYTQAGTQLRTRTYSFLKTQNTLGGEFPVPTPTPTPNGDVVSVSVSPSQINQGGNATFTISRASASSHPLVVNYTMKGTAVNGSDYSLSGSPGQVTIPANATSAQVVLHANFHETSHSTDTAKMYLTAGPGYVLSPNNKATLTIVNGSPG